MSQRREGTLPECSGAKCRAGRLGKCLCNSTSHVPLTLEARLEGETWPAKPVEVAFSGTGALASRGGILEEVYALLFTY